LRRGEEGLPPLNPPSFLGRRVGMIKRGVNSQPKIGTNNVGLESRKQRLNLIRFWMKNKKSRFKDRRGINFRVAYGVGGRGWGFSSVASIEAI
jgi:hypothetical protein